MLKTQVYAAGYPEVKTKYSDLEFNQMSLERVIRTTKDFGYPLDGAVVSVIRWTNGRSLGFLLFIATLLVVTN